MKILYFSLEFLPPLFSGNGTLARLQVNQLAELGQEVLVVCGLSPEQPNQEMTKNKNIQVLPIPISSNKVLGIESDYTGYNIKAIEQIEQILKFQADLILCNDWHAVFVAIMIHNLQKIPIYYHFCRIFSREQKYFQNENDFKLIRAMEKNLVQNSRENIVICQDNGEWLKEQFQTPYELLTPILDDESFSIAESVRIQHKFILPLKLTTFVRLSPEKEIDKMLIFLKNLSLPFDLTIYGEATDEEYADSLQQLVVEQKIQNFVHFEGRLEKKELYQAVSQADFYIHPSQYEPFGISIIEAALLGLPVILPDSEKIGAGELFDDLRSCIRLNFQNYQESRNKLEKLLAENGRLEIITENALGIVENLTIRNYGKKLLNILKIQ